MKDELLGEYNLEISSKLFTQENPTFIINIFRRKLIHSLLLVGLFYRKNSE